jgi:uncharacterized membrane protein SirB2
MYAIAKHSHLMLIALSVSFLIIRVLAVSFDAQWVRKKWVKIAPHIIDTLLLISAISLMVIIQQYPGSAHWLSAKVVALFGYIGFASFAFKGKKSIAIRAGFLLLAIGCIVFMGIVAVTKNPIPGI